MPAMTAPVLYSPVYSYLDKIYKKHEILSKLLYIIVNQIDYYADI